MNWYGQINRTIWELNQAVEKFPDRRAPRRDLVRAHFLQRFEYDKTNHVARDDRTFLFLQEGDAPACLLLHGATGTPAEMRDLGTYLYQNGITAYCPRFARVDASENVVSWESWVTQAETSLEILGNCSKNTFVVGLSLGGTIALILSESKSLTGLALLAPALVPRNTFKLNMLGALRFITPTIFYRFAGWNGEILKAMDAARKSLKRIRIPVMALQAEDDPRLSARGIKLIRKHARLRRNEIRMIKTGGHVITCGPARDEVAEKVRDFVHRVAKTPEDQRVTSAALPQFEDDRVAPNVVSIDRAASPREGGSVSYSDRGRRDERTRGRRGGRSERGVRSDRGDAPGDRGSRSDRGDRQRSPRERSESPAERESRPRRDGPLRRPRRDDSDRGAQQEGVMQGFGAGERPERPDGSERPERPERTDRPDGERPRRRRRGRRGGRNRRRGPRPDAPPTAE